MSCITTLIISVLHDHGGVKADSLDIRLLILSERYIRRGYLARITTARINW